MKKLAPIFLVFLITGCSIFGAPSPETPRERYAAAETTYKAVATTVEQMADAGTLVKGSEPSKRIATALRTARAALDTWGVAPDNQTSQLRALTALQALQAVLAEIQRGINR